MNTLLTDCFITDSPIEIGVFDLEMNFILCSKLWLKTINADEIGVIGKSYYDIFPTTSVAIREIHDRCLTKNLKISEIEHLTLPNGSLQCLNWKINSWKNDSGEIGGLVIVREDITKKLIEEKYRLKAQEVAKIGGWEVNLISNEVYWTKITKEIHNAPEDFIPTLEDGINFYKEGYYREMIFAYVSEAISNGTPWNDEFVILTVDGKEKWVKVIGKVELVDGKAVRLTGTFQDIDAEKKAEINYKESLERFNLAAKSARIGVWDYDIVSKQLNCDDNMYYLFELEKGNFSNDFEAWKSVIYPEDKERVIHEMLISLNHGKEFNTEYRIQTEDGKIKHIKSIAQVQHDKNGVLTKVIGAKWDITDHRNTELKLLKNKESFTGVFDNSSVGMALVSIEGKWLKINNSLSSSLGYSSKELIKLTFQDITHPDDLITDLTLLQELIDEKRDGYQIEKRYYHKNGHIVYVILSVTKVTKIDGSIAHFITQIVDITSRKQAENKLKAVLKITEEQNNSLTNFAHIVSHNLRSHSTNLSMLTGFLSTEEDEAEKKNLMGMLNDSTESLDETIVHLNEVVNVKLNIIDKLENVNISHAFNNVKKSVVALVNDNQVTINCTIPEAHSVSAVPAYLESILLNLLTNSIRYSSPTRLPVIHIKTKRVKDKIILTFKDNGLGIDLKKHKEKIFGMYKTFHKHKDSKGVGLFITKGQMEAMNGKIKVSSIVDVGTTFTLYFKIN
ncbi:PAS domain S-box protein [Cellulophaga sp. F20128]|uniref:PAS domain S-box protein n=1 Tax=Cellulophaga sp. F20128 TaxID=2926413 RepID=UPI001FF40F12|nr:PAS domain S-box protein [Cellulophaga sp. F20128]MCK0157440.1 PAS domain S-box protein [Cellulophaga sp. F20128]